MGTFRVSKECEWEEGSYWVQPTNFRPGRFFNTAALLIDFVRVFEWRFFIMFYLIIKLDPYVWLKSLILTHYQTERKRDDNKTKQHA